MLHSTKTLNSQSNVVGQRPAAQRVAWFLPPMAVKDRGAKCPGRWKHREETVNSRAKHPVGKPNTNYLLNSASWFAKKRIMGLIRMRLCSIHCMFLWDSWNNSQEAS